jgi:hypothetical protein
MSTCRSPAVLLLREGDRNGGGQVRPATHDEIERVPVAVLEPDDPAAVRRRVDAAADPREHSRPRAVQGVHDVDVDVTAVPGHFLRESLAVFGQKPRAGRPEEAERLGV